MPGSEIFEGRSNKLSGNQKFLQNLDRIIESNLSNDQFGVTQLAESLNISRVQLFRRLQKITGKNISQYIREYRLKKAYELLKNETAIASEIAYQVGFNSPSYFNKCFHDFYGYTPGSVTQSLSVEEEDEKIQPLFSKRYSEEKQSSLLNSTEHPNRENKSDTSNNIEIGNGIAGYIFNRKSYVIFLPLLLIIVLLSWKYVPDLFAPEEFQTGEKPIVAVLPFRNDSPDPVNEYLCRGIEDEIRIQLMKIGDLKIMSRQSVDKYQGEITRNLAGIGAELKASHILTGSVRKVAENIRISVQLYDASTEKMIWADTYDGKYTDEIFKFQSDIAIKTASALNTIITPEEKLKLATPSDINITAYDYRLRASEEKWKYWLYDDTVALNNAERFKKKALMLQPDSVDGWLMKAGFYWERYLETEEYFEENFMDSVLWYCWKADQIDPESGSLMKAMVYRQKGDIKRAIQYFEKAIEYLPERDSLIKKEVMWRLGYIHIYNKEYQKGISLIRNAVQIAKGKSRHYGHLLYRLAYAYLWMGDYEQAENFYIQSRDMVEDWYVHHCYLYYFQGDFQAALDCSMCCSPTPTQAVCLYFLGNTYFQLGDFENAVKYFREFRKVREARGRIQWNNLYREGIALVELGRKEEGIKLIEEQLSQLEKRKKLGRPDGYDYHLAAIYAYRGDQEKALQHLRDHGDKVQAPNERAGIPIYFTRYDILFKPLWNNPEFKALLKKELEEKEAGRAEVRNIAET